MNLDHLPEKTGVYLFLDTKAEVIYVGKANSINTRVKQHFRNDRLDSRHISMLSQIKTINYILTANEDEALVLEDQLIKNLKPRYNIALKDDKSYPFLELSLEDEFPALNITRDKSRKKSNIYYGPFPKASDIRAAKRAVDRIFKLRKCRRFRKKDKPCLNYHIKRCYAPCSDNISTKDYSETVQEIKLFLEGKHKELLARLKNKMNKCKEELNYEEAAILRDQISALESIFPLVKIKEINRKKLLALEKVDPLLKLKELMSLKKRPESIMAFDISHTASVKAVGSGVFFRKDEKITSNYRRFRIKQKETSDDIKMMYEVVSRAARAMHEKRLTRPDLILIDGGRAHAKAAERALKNFKISDVAVIGFAKESSSVYFMNRKLALKADSPTYLHLKMIDDEAHRFAHDYHTKRRGKL